MSIIQNNSLKLVWILLFALLTACSSVTLPQIGAVVPCEIQSIEQVEQAILTALSSQHWEVISISSHMIQARKMYNQMHAVAHIAYGYRGFSIEYFDSVGMDYDAEDDTINPLYSKWVYHLSNAIENVLQQQVKLNPPVRCYGVDTPK